MYVFLIYFGSAVFYKIDVLNYLRITALENQNVMYVDTNKVTKTYLCLFHVVKQLGLIASHFLDQQLSPLFALQ